MYVFFKSQVSVSVSAILALYLLGIGSIPKFAVSHTPNVGTGMYSCVFIMLLEVRIAAVQNSKIQGVSLKINALSSWKYPLHQAQP